MPNDLPTELQRAATTINVGEYEANGLRLSNNNSMQCQVIMQRIAHILICCMVSTVVPLAACNSTNKPGPSANSADVAMIDGSTNAVDQQDAQAQACPGTTVASCPKVIPSFSAAIVPIVQARCSVCHSQYNDAGLWPLNDQQSLYDWRTAILEALRSCQQPPPGSGVSLSLTERQAFEAWLVCGASDN